MTTRKKLSILLHREEDGVDRWLKQTQDFNSGGLLFVSHVKPEVKGEFLATKLTYVIYVKKRTYIGK